MPATPQSLGTRIRRARERARLSQDDLARAIDVSVRAIGDWENDRRKPRNSLGALEQVLRVSLEDEAGPESDPVSERLREVFGEVLPEEDPDRLVAVVWASVERRIPPRRRDASRSEKAG